MPALPLRRESRPAIGRAKKPAALFARPPHPFEPGDRVRCMRGPAKGRLGTVVLRRSGRKITVHAGPDQVWVLFDGEGTPSKTRRGAVEKVA